MKCFKSYLPLYLLLFKLQNEEDRNCLRSQSLWLLNLANDATICILQQGGLVVNLICGWNMCLAYFGCLCGFQLLSLFVKNTYKLYHQCSLTVTCFLKMYTCRSFRHSWFITGFVTRLTPRMPLMEQELPTVLVGYIILYVLARVGNFLEFVFQMGLQSVIKLNLDSPLNIVKIFFQIFEDANNQLISEWEIEMFVDKLCHIMLYRVHRDSNLQVQRW